MKIIVLAKQVPDTRNVGKDAMKADGTINRGALPAIFNPEDLHALEQALRIKDLIPETTVSVLTMGPGRASEILREAIYRGADKGYLLTDRLFAGADTLATSYALAMAIKYIGMPDLILCGRQAIDGDTAQVGPQVAEKLGMNTITYAEEVTEVSETQLSVRRRLERGVEQVCGPLPLLVTVSGTSETCRARNAKRLQKYKYAATLTEMEDQTNPEIHRIYNERPYLSIEELTAASVNADPEQSGLSGSPTKVRSIENVVFKAKEAKTINPNEEEIEALVQELIANHTIG